MREPHRMTPVTIPAIEVAKSYLITELSRIFSGDDFQDELKNSIEKLSEKEVWRLLEAFSFTYRLNGVFWLVSDDGYAWSKEEVDCSKLLLTGINPKVDKVVSSPAVENNALKFRDYLVDYFKKDPADDPQFLGEFKPSKTVLQHPTILLTEKEGNFYLMDGSHRLMSHLLAGNKTISAYVGRKVRPGKIKLGDSSFWLLREVYEKGDEVTREAVLIIVKELVKTSSDGRSAVENYWIDHVKEDSLKEAGMKILLDSTKNSNSKISF